MNLPPSPRPAHRLAAAVAAAALLTGAAGAVVTVGATATPQHARAVLAEDNPSPSGFVWNSETALKRRLGLHGV